MVKPIVGIVSKHYAKEYSRPDTYIRDEVKQAIIDNGGIAIGILPPDQEINRVPNQWQNCLSEQEYDILIKQINLCDGIIFQGGGASDNYEVVAAKYCYDNNIPTLGLCCGQNIMIRATGGTLKKVDNPEKHNNKNQDKVHSIKIDRNSKTFLILQKEELLVNSRHKKVVDKTSLKISAYDDDGNIEIVEDSNKKFYIAFRFHPESLYKKDKNINNIFKEFIKACYDSKKK